MDMDSWATLARLAREAKAELEATEPGAEADIEACDNVVELAEAAVWDGTWTTDRDALAEWLDRAKKIAVAVRNAREGDEFMYLPLDGADGAEKILTDWLAQVPEGVRREAQVKYGNDGAEADTAFVMLREHPIRVHDTAEADGSAEAREPGG